MSQNQKVAPNRTNSADAVIPGSLLEEPEAPETSGI